MTVIGVIIFRLALFMTSLMTSRKAAAEAETLRRHDDVIVSPGRCLVRCLTLFQVRVLSCELDGTRWASVDRYAFACSDLDL